MKKLIYLVILTFIVSNCFSQSNYNIRIDSTKYLQQKKQYLEECLNGKKNGDRPNDILHSCAYTLGLDSTNFEAAKIIGDLYFKNDQYVEAIKYYDKALRIKPNDTGVYMLTATAYGLLADKEESYYETAIQYINTYLDKFSDDANVLIAKYNLLEKRDKNEAANFRIKACELDPFYCNKSLLFVVDSLILNTETLINTAFSINTSNSFFDKSKDVIKKSLLSNTQYTIVKDEVNKLEYEDKKTTNQIFFLFENLKCRALRYSSIANDDKTIFNKMRKTFKLELDANKHFTFSNKYNYEATIYFDVANGTIPYINYYLYKPAKVADDKNKLVGDWILTTSVYGSTVLAGSTLKLYKLTGVENEYMAVLNQGYGDMKYKAVLSGNKINFMGNDKLNPQKIGVVFTGTYDIEKRLIDVTLNNGKRGIFAYLDLE